MADVIQCTEACTVTLVHEISIPPFNLELGEAGLIAAAILAIWAVGFTFRALIHMVRSSDGVTLENET